MKVRLYCVLLEEDHFTLTYRFDIDFFSNQCQTTSLRMTDDHGWTSKFGSTTDLNFKKPDLIRIWPSYLSMSIFLTKRSVGGEGVLTFTKPICY